MKISVALTTYNGSKFILAQLNSILCQSRKVDEVMISDDGSVDNTAEIVRDFINANKLESTWHFSVNEKNFGFAENFRKAIYSCTGDVVFFSDQDDIWVTDRLEKMTQVMQENPQIQVLTTKYRQFSNDPAATRGKEKLSLRKINFDAYNRYLRSYGCAMCARRVFLDRIRGDWYPGWAHDEAIWSLSVIHDELYYFDFCSVYHRCHGNNVSGNMGHDREKRIRYLREVQTSSRHLYETACKEGLQKKIQKTFSKNIRMAEMRLDLVENRKWSCLFRLIFFVKYYYAPKSYLVEGLIALKRN